MKVALYARVSTRDKGQNPENQLRDLRQLADAKKWEVFQEYVDFDSGSKAERPQLQAMMTDASRRRFDTILFWSLDRFSREGVFPTIARLNQLADYGVRYVSYKEADIIDTTRPFGKALVALFAELAEIERNRIKERIVAGLSRVRAEGKILGRPKRIFRRDEAVRLRDEGLPLREIAKRLNVSKGTIQNVIAEYRKTSETA